MRTVSLALLLIVSTRALLMPSSAQGTEAVTTSWTGHQTRTVAYSRWATVDPKSSEH